MTRINCVPVQELHDKHLAAEYRELPRVFKLAAAAHARGEDPSQFPGLYTLGKGHVKFFYTRLGWLKWRFQDLVAEMQHRGWQPQYTQVPSVADALPASWWGFWEPTPQALAINRQRIADRMPSSLLAQVAAA